MQFNFHFGKKEPSWTKRIATALFFVSAVPFIAKVTHLKEQSLYDFIDDIVRRYAPDSVFSEYIINTDKMINRRIERDVDKAVDDYTEKVPPVTITEFNYNEEPSDGSEAQELLGGSMSLSAPFMDKSDN